jgi:hypothetical protein
LSFFMNKKCFIVFPSRIIFPSSTFGDNNFHEVMSHKSLSCKKNSNFIFHVWKLLPFNFSILQASKVDTMIVNKIMSWKNTKSFETFSKMLKKQNTPNVVKFSRTIKSNFNLSFLQKQPCFDTMLEINSTSMRK